MKVHQCFLLLGLVEITIQFCTAFVGPSSSTFVTKSRRIECNSSPYTRKICDGSIQKGIQKHSITRPFLYRNHDEEARDSSMNTLEGTVTPTFNVDVESKSINKSEGINNHLLQAFFINQLFILSLSIAFTAAYLFISADFQFVSDGILNWTGFENQFLSQTGPSLSTPVRLLEGIIGYLPMMLFGLKLEASDDRRLARANFSTVYMVMSMFGRRSRSSSSKQITKKNTDKEVKLDTLEPVVQSSDVALISLGLSTITALCEEFTFRGMIPHVLKATIFNGSIPLTYIGQAIIFGLAHNSPTRGGENRLVVPSVQFINGLWLGFIYLSTNGDILPCIIAHALYDFQILSFTWNKTNDQIEYAFYKSLEPVPADSIMEVNALQREFKVKIEDSILEIFKKVFFVMDSDKDGMISKSEAQKGISYLDIEGILVAPSQKLVSSIFDQCINIRGHKCDNIALSATNQLRLSDFIRLLLAIKVLGNSDTQTSKKEQK